MVDLEIIEGRYATIEFKSNTTNWLRQLVGVFGITESDLIKGPVVTAIRELLV